MSISEAGQNVLIKIIVDRLNGINIDFVAKILSSNVCENYFSVLTKFLNGKRKNGDFTDTWRIQHYVVAGLISSEIFVSELMEKVGSPPNHIRQQKLESINRAKRYQKGFHKTVEQKKRRRLATQIRQHALGKLENNKNRHVSDKIQPEALRAPTAGRRYQYTWSFCPIDDQYMEKCIHLIRFYFCH